MPPSKAAHPAHQVPHDSASLTDMITFAKLMEGPLFQPECRPILINYMAAGTSSLGA